MRFRILAILVGLFAPVVVTCVAQSTPALAKQGGDTGVLLAQKSKAAATIVLPNKPLPASNMRLKNWRETSIWRLVPRCRLSSKAN